MKKYFWLLSFLTFQLNSFNFKEVAGGLATGSVPEALLSKNTINEFCGTGDPCSMEYGLANFAAQAAVVIIASRNLEISPKLCLSSQIGSFKSRA